MKIDIIGLSLRMKTLQPILVIQPILTADRYILDLPLEEATILAGAFHSMGKGTFHTVTSLMARVTSFPKSITKASIIFSKDGIPVVELEYHSWFRKKYSVCDIATGIILSIHSGIALHTSSALLDRLEEAQGTELHRALRTTLTAVESEIMYDAITSEEGLLGMKPESTLIM